MSPKKVYDLNTPNLTFDKSSGRYRYRSPITGKRETLSRDRDEAIEKAEILNALVETRRLERIHGHVSISLGLVIDSYISERIPMLPWEDLHTRNILTSLGAIKKDLGSQPLKKVDRQVIAKWIAARGVAGHAKRRYRLTFCRLFEHAIGNKWADLNEGEMVPKYSRSKKLAENKVLRKRMTLDQFWLIHDNAPLYIQIAMQMSLVTLQARQEILNMQYSDIRDNHLFVVRKKTATESDAAFIKIQITPEIERIVTMSRSSRIVSPYIVHRLPRSRQKSCRSVRPHPTFISPQQFTYNFGYARTRAGITQQYESRQAPSFHEIRSLGSRLMLSSGVARDAISALMAHGSAKTSDIYLDGRDAVTDDAYKSVHTTAILKR